MLLADTAPYFETCPRCGEGGLEKLKTHSHCVNCNYAEVPESGSIESVLANLNKEMDIAQFFEKQKADQSDEQTDDSKNKEAA